MLALLKSKDGVRVVGSSHSSSSTEKEKNVISSSENNDSNKPLLPIPTTKSSAMVPLPASSSTDELAKKKRCYETPATKIRPHKPGTILRTARRGEGLYSKNGSPLEPTAPGTVIATVHKKQCRGLGQEQDDDGAMATADVEMNVGEGQYIRLNDPFGVSELDSKMKQTAAIQLKVLQDQMESLMAQLRS
jgi:hypothetical protein